MMYNEPVDTMCAEERAPRAPETMPQMAIDTRETILKATSIMMTINKALYGEELKMPETQDVTCLETSIRQNDALARNLKDLTEMLLARLGL